MLVVVIVVEVVVIVVVVAVVIVVHARDSAVHDLLCHDAPELSYIVLYKGNYYLTGEEAACLFA